MTSVVAEDGATKGGDVSRRTAALLLGAIVVVAAIVRLAWLSRPNGGLIFDEKYYVSAARIIAGIPVAPDMPYASAPLGLDPNTEHPPLAKAIIAMSIEAFGDNPFGWRLPSVFFGVVSILPLYGIACRLGVTRKVALAAAFLFAFDSLVFVLSRIATLDIALVAFLLTGLYLYLAEFPTLAGIALAGATMCKLNGVYGIAGLWLFELARHGGLQIRGGPSKITFATFRPLIATTIVYVASVPGLLAILDRRFSSFGQPFAHVQHALGYGVSLTRAEGPQGQESLPWQWLVNDIEMTYLRVDVSTLIGKTVQTTRATVWFRGSMNPYVIAMLPVAFAYAAARAWQRVERISLFVLSLFTTAYVPFVLAAVIAKRISYIHYFLPAIPFLALGTAHLIYARGIPRAARWAYFAAVLWAFVERFPFRHLPP